jgi:hypothetical protein
MEPPDLFERYLDPKFRDRVILPIGADRMCVSTDYPHFDSNFPDVSENVLKSCSRETAAQILMGGVHLYGLSAADFEKADAAAGGARAATNGGPDAASPKGRGVTVGG